MRTLSLNPAASAGAAMLASLATGIALVEGGRAGLYFIGVMGVGALTILVERLGLSAIRLWLAAGAALYPFLRFPTQHSLVTFDRVWIGAMVACIALAPRRIREARQSRYVQLAFGWLVVSFLARALLTSGPSSGLAVVGIWVDAILLPFVLFVAVRRLTTTARDVEKLALALAFGGAVVAVIGIGERLFGFELATRFGAVVRFDAAVGLVRISGPYPYPEVFSLVLVISLAASLLAFQVGSSQARILAVIAGFLQATGIALSLFRAAWISGAIVLIVAFGLRPRRFRRLVAVGLVALVLGGLGYSELSHNGVFTTRVSGTVATDNVWGRLATYDQGLTIARGAPLFGVGVNQYPVAALRRPPNVVNGVSAVPYPHSSYVGLLAEQGLVGFAPFLVLSVAVWALLRRLRRRAVEQIDVVLAASATGAALGYLLMSLTLTMLPMGPSNAIFAAFIGLVAARLDVQEALT